MAIDRIPPRFSWCSALRLATLSTGLALSVVARAAFDMPASWDVSSETDYRAQNFSRYDAPWNLFQSLLTPEVESRIFSDAEKRIPTSFQVPTELEPQVHFWLRIYAQYSSQEALIFDEEHPDIVYEKLDFRELARTSRNRAAYEIVSRSVLKRRVDAYRAGFAELSRKPHKRGLSREAQQILRARAGLSHPHPPREAMAALRVQWGQRDQVMTGLLASSSFLHRMEKIFTDMGLPQELVLLSLVESSFNWSAVSYAGAAGVWQFMPGPGSEFLTVHTDGEIDERLSPIKSTVAAGKLLTRNYRMLGTWPMAISAYNHGHVKWARLRPDQWNTFLRVISQCSRSKPAFKLGFASRNYYPEFLALLRAYRYQDLAYGPVPIERLTPAKFIEIRKITTLAELSVRHGVSETELRRLNPDLKLAHPRIPAGYWLSLPAPDDNFADLIKSRRRVVRAESRKPSRPHLAEDFKRITPRG